MFNQPQTESTLEIDDLFYDFHFTKSSGDCRIYVDLCTNFEDIKQYPEDVIFAQPKRKLINWVLSTGKMLSNATFYVIPREGTSHGELHVSTSKQGGEGVFLCRLNLDSIPCTAKAMQF